MIRLCNYLGCNKRSALHRMFCKLGDTSPTPARPVSCGAQSSRWLEENKNALDEYNRRIETRGTFSDGLRRF